MERASNAIGPGRRPFRGAVVVLGHARPEVSSERPGTAPSKTLYSK